MLSILLNFRSAVDELVVPELELRVLDEFNEGDEETPWVRSVDNQPLQQHACYLLLYRLRVCFGKQVQQSAAEVVRVAVGIAQLIGNGVQKQIPTCTCTDTLVTSRVTTRDVTKLVKIRICRMRISTYKCECECCFNSLKTSKRQLNRT